MAPALAIRDVRKSFGAQPVLDGLDLVVPDGSLTAVLGPSGSGKTTLLRLIAGFEHADAGTIRVGDLVVSQPPRHVAPEHRGVGIVAQEGSLFPHLDVAANVGFGLSRAARRSGRVQELLRLVGLAGFERRYPHELSGGEQQRIALARALAPRPRLILLDEPFSALDPLLRADLRNQVREALRAAGSTALLVTHDQLEALSIADQVGVMRRGRLVQVADPQTLYRKPVDVELARFVGEAVLVPGSIATGHIQCALGRLALDNPALADGPATAMLRPEQVVVNVNGNGSPGGVSGRVERITFHGPDALVHLALSACDDLDIVARVAGHALPSLGQPVTLSVNGPVVAFTGNLDDGRRGSLSRRPQIEPA